MAHNPTLRAIIDEVGFRELVAGRAATLTIWADPLVPNDGRTLEVLLSDIGWERMIQAISEARTERMVQALSRTKP